MKKSKKRLLWKIRPADSNIESYLFGTIHLRKKSFAEKVEKLKPYISKCRVFSSEIDLDTNYVDVDFSRSFYLPGNKSLSELLGFKKYEKAKKILAKAFNFKLDLYQHHIPLISSQAIAEHVLKSEAIEALDYLLWNLAKKEGLICRGIESMAEQLKVLNGIPIDTQLKSFKDVCQNVSKFRKLNNRLLNLYEAEDIQKIYKESKKSLGGIREIMLYERNRNMANRINKLSREEANFFAIGAAHLAGAKGLLAMLKQHDIEVKPIDYSNL
jgi:uncharacterized protein YbaP (TraB family)